MTTLNFNRPRKRLGPLPFAQHELDELHCERAGCSHAECDVPLFPSCHNESPMRIAYVRTRGVLQLTCAACDTLVCEIQVCP